MTPKTATFSVATRATLLTLAMGICLCLAPAQAQTGFTAPVPIDPGYATDDAFDQYISLATDHQGHWVAVWMSDNTLQNTVGTDNDVLVTRSIDNGLTWTAPVALNSAAPADSANDYKPRIYTDRNGAWICVWTYYNEAGGTTGTDSDIMFSRSTNNGQTWTAQAPLNTDATSDNIDDTTASAAADGQGHWIVAWERRHGSGTDYDIHAARSADSGATWTAPAALNSNAATDSEADGYVVLATDRLGHWLAVWSSRDSLGGTIGTDEDLLFSRSSDNGANWTPVTYLNSNAPGADPAPHDIEAQIAVDGVGNWVVVWNSGERPAGATDNDTEIYFARSTNFGATWTPATCLYERALNDGGDGEPALAVDDEGHWVCIWSSNHLVGGADNYDEEIFLSRTDTGSFVWTTPQALHYDTALLVGFHNEPVLATAQGHWVALWNLLPDPFGSGIVDDDMVVSRMDRVTDSDGDGIPDSSETDTGTFVDDWDTGTDPASPDTDTDTLPDGWEIDNSLGPFDNGSVDPDNGPAGDPDGDTYTNYDEYTGGSDPRDPASFPLPMSAMSIIGLIVLLALVIVVALFMLVRRPKKPAPAEADLNPADAPDTIPPSE